MGEPRRARRSIYDLINEYVRRLEEQAEELGTALTERPSWDLQSCCLEALCNVSVGADQVIVTADLPYTDPDTITVEQIDNEVLEIKAEMKRKVSFAEFGVTHRQGEFRYFRCQTRIPVPVDIKRMKTKFQRGFLSVHLPRKKGHKIRVE